MWRVQGALSKSRAAPAGRPRQWNWCHSHVISRVSPFIQEAAVSRDHRLQVLGPVPRSQPPQCAHQSRYGVCPAASCASRSTSRTVSGFRSARMGAHSSSKGLAPPPSLLHRLFRYCRTLHIQRRSQATLVRDLLGTRIPAASSERSARQRKDRPRGACANGEVCGDVAFLKKLLSLGKSRSHTPEHVTQRTASSSSRLHPALEPLRPRWQPGIYSCSDSWQANVQTSRN